MTEGESDVVNRCCIPGCKGNSKTHAVYRVPSGEIVNGKDTKEWREKMIRALRNFFRDDLGFRIQNHQVDKGDVFVCWRHFKRRDIIINDGKTWLKHGALPSKRAGSSHQNCSAYGCYKVKKRIEIVAGRYVRSDSEGSEDEESAMKRKLPRSFHSFPADPKLRKQWITNTRRKNWVPTQCASLCSDHFEEKYINRNGQMVRLRRGAVPTRFKAHPRDFKEAEEEVVDNSAVSITFPTQSITKKHDLPEDKSS